MDLNMPDTTVELPPSKKLKSEQEFIGLIEDCYELHFNVNADEKTEEEKDRLREGLAKIRVFLEQAESIGDTFGKQRIQSRITWGKCVSLMLETGPENLMALKNLCGRLNPGGGLF